MADIYQDVPELYADEQSINRRRKIAEAMALQAQAPMATNQMAGGYVVPISPLAGIAKVLSAYMANKQLGGYDTEMKGLATRKSQMIADEIAKVQSTANGTPERPAEVLPEDVSGPAQPGAAAVPGNPRQAVLDAMNSNFQRVRDSGKFQLAEQYRKEDKATATEQRQWEITQKSQDRLDEIKLRAQEGRISKEEADKRTAAENARHDKELAQSKLDSIQFAASMRTPAGGAEKPPKGYRQTADGNLEAIPGGPADTKIQGALNADTQARDSSITALDRLGAQVNLVKESNLGRITGIPGAFPNVPGSAGSDAQARLDALKAQVGFGVLQELRNTAKSSASGLGQVTEKEHVYLQQQLGNLAKAQSEEEIRRVLGDMEIFVYKSKERIRSAYNLRHSDQNAAPDKPRVVDW